VKILYWTPRIVSTRDGTVVGGSVNAMLNLIKAAAKDLEIVLFAHTDKGCKEYLLEHKLGVSKLVVQENRIRPNTIIYGLSFILRALFKICRMKGWNADVIHGHSGFATYALLSGLLGKTLGKPSVHSLYCPVKRCGSARTRLIRLCLNSNDMLIAMSQNVKNSLLAVGILAEKISVLPQHVDLFKYSPDNYSQSERDRYGVSKHDVLILYVGNLKLSKGLDLLIDSLGTIQKSPFCFLYTLEHKDVQHDDRMKEINEKIEKLSLSNHTQKLGIIESMPTLLASADLLVIPYRDTFGPSDYPLILLEAMASGVPAVGSEVGGIPELIEDNVTGKLVPPNNPLELARAIDSLLEDKETRKNMGTCARRKLQEMLLPENLHVQIVQFYNKINKRESG